MTRIRHLHLVQRGGVYYFRAAVPVALQARLGRGEIKLSTRTRDVFTARQMCRRMTSCAEALFAFCYSMAHLTDQQLQEISRDYFRALLEEGNELVWCVERDPSLSAADEAENAQKLSGQYKARYAEGKTPAHVQDDVTEALAKHGLTDVSPKDEAFDILKKAFMRARVESYRIQAAKLMKDHDKEMPLDALFSGMLSQALPAVEATKTAGSDLELGKLVDKYIELHSKTWAYKTLYDKKRALSLMVEIFGAKRVISTIKADDVAHLAETLSKLPKNAQQKHKDKTLKELLEIAKQTGDVLHPKTATKYLGMAKSLFIWCEAREYIPKVPGKDIEIPFKEMEKPKLPFSADQLKVLFGSPLYTGYGDPAKRYKSGSLLLKDEQYWIPLVALYSGLRLGEVIQLHSTDIKAEAGIHYFDLAETTSAKKKLKTKYSHRRVPVHPELLKLGFLVYVSDKVSDGVPLFPTFVSAEKSPGTKYGKTFARYLMNIGMKNSKTTFHSFRHNFADALDHMSVPEAHKNAMMGHSGKAGMSAHYGQTMPIKVLYESLSKISYGIENLVPKTGKN